MQLHDNVRIAQRSWAKELEDSVALNMRAKIAVAFVEKWGMVASEIDGEDSAGRQKLRLMTPDEIVERACVTAALLLIEFERRNWLTEVPETESDEGTKNAD